MNQDTEAEGLVRLAYESAIAAAREAGAYLIKKQRHVQVLYKKALRDDLLDADLEAEAIILNILRLSFPTFDIFSEEAGEENGKTQRQWIVDPCAGYLDYPFQIERFGHGSLAYLPPKYCQIFTKPLVF
jgi:3'-phosphoadenosine 5'-phosphosulfate (PAPS) 3'-phosphatase